MKKREKSKRAYSFFLSMPFLCRLPKSQEGSGNLRIKNAQIWHEGRYTCTARTVADGDTAYADLKVVGQSARLSSRASNRKTRQGRC